MIRKRIYLPRKRNRPMGLFHHMGRTYGVIVQSEIVKVEDLREAYLTYRPATDDHHPPENMQKPPYNATGGELEWDGGMPDIMMPELDDLFDKPPNELAEAQDSKDGFLFKWEDGGMTIKGRHFDAEHIAFVLRSWLTEED